MEMYFLDIANGADKGLNGRNDTRERERGEREWDIGIARAIVTQQQATL